MDEEISRGKIFALIGIACSYISLIPGITMVSAPVGVICSVVAIKDHVHVTGITRVLTYMACAVSLVLMFINYTFLFSELLKPSDVP